MDEVESMEASLLERELVAIVEESKFLDSKKSFSPLFYYTPEFPKVDEIVNSIMNTHLFKDNAGYMTSPLMFITEENKEDIFEMFLNFLGIMNVNVNKRDILSFMVVIPCLKALNIEWKSSKVQQLTETFDVTDILDITGMDFFQSMFLWATGFKLKYSLVPVNNNQAKELSTSFFAMRNAYVSLFIYSKINEPGWRIEHPFSAIITYGNTLLIEYIMEYSVGNPDIVLDMLKMVPYNTEDYSYINDYFFRSIYRYNKLTLNRDKDFVIYAPITSEDELHMLTDAEIFKYIFEGAEIKNYYSRDDILALCQRRIERDRWSRLSLGYCQNNNRGLESESEKEIRSLPTEQELNDPSWVSYGKPLNYYCYRMSLYNSRYWTLKEITKKGYFERYDYKQNESDKYLNKASLLKLKQFIPILEREDKLDLSNIKESIDYALPRMETDDTVIIVSDNSIYEYMQFSVSNSIFDKLKGRENNDYKIRELQNAYERYLISKANETIYIQDESEKFESITIFNRKISDVDQIFVREVNQKMGSPEFISIDFITNVIHKTITDKLAKFGDLRATLIKNPLTYDNDSIRWIQLNITNKEVKIDKLIEKAGIIDTTNMLLRYGALMAKNASAGIPFSVAEYLYNERNVRYEAFASPINSRFMYYPGAKFYSLFEDVDQPFGSRGDFFRSNDKFEASLIVNPPFTEKLLLDASIKAQQILSSNKVDVYFFSPNWNDAEYYKSLENSGYLKIKKDVEKGVFFFEDNMGKQIIPVAMTLFILSSRDTVEDYSPYADKIIQLGNKREEESHQDYRRPEGYRGRGGSEGYRGRGSTEGYRGRGQFRGGSERGRGSTEGYRGRGSTEGYRGRGQFRGRGFNRGGSNPSARKDQNKVIIKNKIL
jgi:hypothetical protein